MLGVWGIDMAGRTKWTSGTTNAMYLMLIVTVC